MDLWKDIALVWDAPSCNHKGGLTSFRHEEAAEVAGEREEAFLGSNQVRIMPKIWPTFSFRSREQKASAGRSGC